MKFFYIASKENIVRSWNRD